MFIPLVTDKDNTVEFNTSQLCYLDGNNAQMSNGFTIHLSDESVAILKENLYGTTEATNPKVAEKTASLLTELHNLCGGKGEAKATSDRKARLKTRMKDFSEEELKTAAKHLGENAFMQGENDSNKRYGTLDYLLRTSANVNKWMEEETADKPKKMF